jgi:hypothetical protein
VASAAPFADQWAGARADAGRAARAAGRGADDPEAAAAAAAEAAKRAARREETMSAGLASFDVWLADLVRQGLGAVRRQPYRFWDDAAARLVDAQVPGLADRVRNAAGIVQRPGDWAPALLAEVGRWYTAVAAWGRRASLPEALAADLATFLGLPRRKDDVIAAAGGGERDRWHVIGVRLGGDERLRSQRTWLAAESTGELVLLLDFAAAGATLHVPGVVGTVVDATVARYPGSPPQRGLFTGDQRVLAERAVVPGGTDVEGALDRRASYLAGNPWLDRVPAALVGAPVMVDGEAWVVDDVGSALPIGDDVDHWQLLAVSGGRRATLFGELEAGRFHAASVAVDDALVPL